MMKAVVLLEACFFWARMCEPSRTVAEVSSIMKDA
jgi:hypothetical protein